MAARVGSRLRLLAAGALAGAAAAVGAAISTAQHQRDAEERFPPSGRFLDAAGVRLHYIDTEGDGPPVLMLHGNGAMIADLAISGLVTAVARRHRTLVFDRPGYGYSERPHEDEWGPREQARLFHAALEEIGVRRPVVVVGQSWGTLVALAMVLEFPAAVAGLVLASGYYYPQERPEMAALAAPAMPVAGSLMRNTIAPYLTRKLAPRAIARMFAPQPVTERFQAEFPLPLSLRPEQIRASAEEVAIMNAAAADLSRHYREIACPTALIAGTADEIVDTTHQSARLAGDIPGSTLDLLPGMGHMLHHFEAERIAALVDQVGSA